MQKVLQKLIAAVLMVGASSMLYGVEPKAPEEQTRIFYHEPFEFQMLDMIGRRQATEIGTDEAFTLLVEAHGQQFELVLESNQQLIANLPQDQQDSLADVQLYRGYIVGVPGSWARLTQIGDQFSGSLWDGIELYFIDPVDAIADDLGTLDAVAGTRRATRDASVIYRLSDTDMGDQSCALEPAEQPLQEYGHLVGELRRAAQASAMQQLDIAIVADAQFVQANSNPTTAVVTRMNVVDGIFSEQVGVHLNVIQIKLLNNNGSLTSTNASGLLKDFRAYTASSSFHNPGLAHLVTGRNLQGSTIGIAYISVLCSSYGVAVSEVIGSGTTRALTIAHELGHNFGAPHDNQSGSICNYIPNGYIMNPSLNGSDQFSQCSLDQMQLRINSATCLTEVDDNGNNGGGEETFADMRVLVPTNPVTAIEGDVFDFTVEVKNQGAAVANDVLAEIDLPSAVDINDLGQCYEHSNGNVECDFNNIAVGARKTSTIELIATAPGSFTTTVSVSSSNDNNPQNDSATIAMDFEQADDPESDLRVIASPSSVAADVNDTFNYSFKIRNDGDGVATGVGVSISLPSAVKVTHDGACTTSNSLVNCNLAEIAAGAEKALSITLQALQVGDFSSTVTASADNDINEQNNSTSISIRIEPVEAEPPSAPPEAELLIDNTSAQTSATGTWYTSSGPNPYGNNSVYNSNGKTFSWMPIVTETGTYRVEAWWTHHVNRSNNVPYRIHHKNGVATVTVNQNNASLGGRWNVLGTYAFSSGGSYKIEVSSENGQASADAVRLVKVIEPDPTPIAPIVIDNEDNATSFTGGPWRRSVGLNPYGNGSIYNNSASTFRWLPTITQAGTYQVYVWWTYHKNRSSNVPYRIKHAGGVTTKFVNQHNQSLGGQWNLLGTYQLSSGNGNYVEVSSENGQAGADAIKLIKLD